MIKTRRDLHFFLDEDRKRNSIPTVWGGVFFAFVSRQGECKSIQILKMFAQV